MYRVAQKNRPINCYMHKVTTHINLTEKHKFSGNIKHAILSAINFRNNTVLHTGHLRAVSPPPQKNEIPPTKENSATFIIPM